MNPFAKQLQFGKAAEQDIALWLRGRGSSLIPVYEKIIEEGKGPQVFLPEDSLIAPDFLEWRNGKVRWIEAKHKTAFSWHRLTNRWVTGIDLHHYLDYLRVSELTPWPVWILFLQRGGAAKDSPSESPVGLFGNDIAYLRSHENHRSMRHGKGGMVYWAIDSLRFIAPINEVTRGEQ